MKKQYQCPSVVIIETKPEAVLTAASATEIEMPVIYDDDETYEPEEALSRQWLLTLLLLLLPALTAMAQTVGDAFYIYRNDGQFNAFFRSEVDSMAYSNYDADSVYCDEVVTQVVYTPDSIYRIPLAAIDSVGFVQPANVYKKDVTRIDHNLLDYVIGADGLVLKLKLDTPNKLVPVKGDKLVLLEGCDVLPNGFAGIVSNIQTESSSIDVVCEQAYLEDLFASFCSVSTVYGASTEAENAARSFPGTRRRVIYEPDDVVLSLGPYKVNRSYEVSQGIAFDGDLALSGGASYSVEIEPTFKIHTLLILGEGQGTYFQYKITGDLRVTTQSSLYGGLSYNHDFDDLTASCPIPATANMVNFYINPGLFVRADATIAGSVTSTQKYTFGSAFDFSSKGLNTVKPSIGGRLASSTVDMTGSLDGSIAGGAYLEVGFSLLSRELAKVCVRGELGARFSGSFVFRNSEIEKASKDTKLYERLKASNVELSSFANISLQASVAHTGNGLTWELSEPIHTWSLVPEFSNLSWERDESGNSGTLMADISRNLLPKVSLGWGLYDDEDNQYAAPYYFPSTYRKIEDWQQNGLEYPIKDLPYGVRLRAYPMVKLMGVEMRADKYVELSSGVLVRNVGKAIVSGSSATATGYVEGHENGAIVGDAGFCYTSDPYSEDWEFASAITMEDGEFTVTLTGLRPQTTYYYCSYARVDGEYYYADEVLTLTAAFPVLSLSSFKVTKSQYQKGAFSHEGQSYDYRFDVSVTETIGNNEVFADWGYVYRDPNGREKKISLLQPSGYGTYYTDTRYAYYRNGTPPFTCTLVPYVEFFDSDIPVYGEPQDFPLEVSFTSCPDANHPHWIDLGLPSGTKWRCCNEGASTPEAYGGYYNFGQVSSAPTIEQIEELRDSTTSVWTTQNGVNGRKFTGPNGGTIFLPAAGDRGRHHGQYEFYSVGSVGFYSSSTPYGRDNAYDLGFTSDIVWVSNYDPYLGYGMSVRPVR